MLLQSTIAVGMVVGEVKINLQKLYQKKMQK